MEQTKELWYDARSCSAKKLDEVLPLVLNNSYDGIFVTAAQADLAEKWPTGTDLLVFIGKEKDETVKAIAEKYTGNRRVIFFSEESSILSRDLYGAEPGIYAVISDKDTMNSAIELSNQCKNVILEFTSETNIPLELVLAYSQKNKSRICKLITSAEDGWIATMTMEMGSYSVLLKSEDFNEIGALRNKLNALTATKSQVEELTVIEVSHIGMGDRVCIDTTSKLGTDEGMIIGSTSSGGILVSSETHYLPYMDLRPFRVNAGAIHSYVWAPNNMTRYLSELKAGDEVLAIKGDGTTRTVSVGRVKIERRPMLLIVAESDNGTRVNVIVQDDWHIRILNGTESVQNATRFKPGDKILGMIDKPGRHLGVEIDETILEK